jgi:hypothetical protein
MSTSRYDPTTNDHIPGAQSLQAGLEMPVRFLGFWIAIIAPFVLLGLVSAGIAQQSPVLLGGLLAANVTGLVLGKDYKQ